MITQHLALLLGAALLSGVPTPSASSTTAEAPVAREVVRSVTRQYGDGPVRHVAESDVVKIRFRGRSGDRVSLHWVGRGGVSSPADAFYGWCSSVTLRPMHGRHESPPDDRHALTLRRNGWHVVTYRACGQQSRRPPALQLLKWDVQPLALDGAAGTYVRRRAFLAVFEVEAEAGEWLHLQSDTPARSGGARFPETVPFFTSDLKADRTAVRTGTYTFVEDQETSDYFDRVHTARIRARRIVQLPPVEIGLPHTFVVTDPGQWQVSSIQLPAGPLFRLRFDNSTLLVKDGWQAVLSLDPPMNCGPRAPNGCGDYTVTHTPGPSLGVAYEGLYRLLLTTPPGVTGSVDLVVEPCPTAGC